MNGKGLLLGLSCLGLLICGTSYAADSSFRFVGATTVSVSDCASVTGNSSGWCRRNWPPNGRGTVYQYSFQETRLATGAVLVRTAYVYKPDQIRAGTSYPLLTWLHGGTQSADQMFENFAFAELADGRSDASKITWRQNTASCQQGPHGSSLYKLGGTSVGGFVSTGGNGSSCTPPNQKYARPSSAPAFFLVLPNGIEDAAGNGRSWEDGRNPSPGQYSTPNPDQQKRDDVGFIDTLIATIKQQQGTLVDATRVYIGGVSNGGLMTTRLLCNVNAYPELARVAAYSVSVGSMADNLYTGANGREQCTSAGTQLAALSIFVGYSSPTPNAGNSNFVANCNPYNPSDPAYPSLPACPYPTTSGDSVMPYGPALDVGGGTYTVNSPTTGKVIASFDNERFWLNYLSASGAGAANVSSGSLGYFSLVRRYSFARSPLLMQVIETVDGLHYNNSARADFEATARIYDFLFSFRKSNGLLQYVGGSIDAASGRFGNLSGVY